jgi:hypothetical protein
MNHSVLLGFQSSLNFPIRNPVGLFGSLRDLLSSAPFRGFPIVVLAIAVGSLFLPGSGYPLRMTESVLGLRQVREIDV